MSRENMNKSYRNDRYFEKKGRTRSASLGSEGKGRKNPRL
jgi:hypothetical protein